jgi:hypothetical protein
MAAKSREHKTPTDGVRSSSSKEEVDDDLPPPTVRPITSKQKAKEELARQAFFDSLPAEYKAASVAATTKGGFFRLPGQEDDTAIVPPNLAKNEQTGTYHLPISKNQPLPCSTIDAFREDVLFVSLFFRAGNGVKPVLSNWPRIGFNFSLFIFWF